MAEQYLVITAVGADRPGIVAELTSIIAQHGANVADSRMAILGGEFALMMLVSGRPEAVGAARQEIETTAQRLDLQLTVRETASPLEHRARRVRSYDLHVHALDHPGIVHAVTTALRELGGNVVALDTSAYPASITGTPLFEMSVRADFPETVTASRLREALSHVSEAANADVDVIPV